VPVGAVVVREGRVIARSFNQVELLKDATAHAEMLALTQAEGAVGDWRLTDCTLYVTKEPCRCALALSSMCAWPGGVRRERSKAGAAGSALNLLQFPTLNHRCEITGGCVSQNAAPSSKLLRRATEAERMTLAPGFIKHRCARENCPITCARSNEHGRVKIH